MKNITLKASVPEAWELTQDRKKKRKRLQEQ